MSSLAGITHTLDWYSVINDQGTDFLLHLQRQGSSSAVAHCTSFLARPFPCWDSFCLKSSRRVQITGRLLSECLIRDAINYTDTIGKNGDPLDKSCASIPRASQRSLVEIYLTLELHSILSFDRDIKITQSLGFEYFMGHEYFSLRFFSRLTNHGLVRLLSYKLNILFNNIFHFIFMVNFLQVRRKKSEIK